MNYIRDENNLLVDIAWNVNNTIPVMVAGAIFDSQLNWMHTIFVDIPHRGQGLGADMLATLLDELDHKSILIAAEQVVFDGYYNKCSQYVVNCISRVEFINRTSDLKSQRGCDCFFTLQMTGTTPYSD